MREAIAVADCTLVGRVRGKPYSSVFLQEWGEKSFTPERPVNFEAQVLAKGWFKFKFEDTVQYEFVMRPRIRSRVKKTQEEATPQGIVEITTDKHINLQVDDKLDEVKGPKMFQEVKRSSGLQNSEK